MEFGSQEFLVGYILYIALPTLIYLFTIGQSKQIKNVVKCGGFITIAIIVFVYYGNYISETNKIDCILKYFDQKELYSKDYVVSKCLEKYSK